MKKTKVVVIVLGLVIGILGSIDGLCEVRIELSERIKIPDYAEFPANPWSLCVTEDEVFIVPDYNEGTIKTFVKNNGTLERGAIIGQKGYKTGELGAPAYCFYEKDRLAVLDRELRKIFFYDRIGRVDFKRDPVKEIYCLRLGYDIQLSAERLFISGYIEDQNENPYDLYYINTKTDGTKFLLPFYEKYGIKPDDRQGEMDRKIAIGVKGWFDIQGENIYHIWEGDLRIIKLNINALLITQVFGYKTVHYKQPRVTESLLENSLKGSFEQVAKERDRFSYVKELVVNSKYILVVYDEPPSKKNPGRKTWLQAYNTADGTFKNEMPIP
ncbi:MAG: hypothetical protein L0Y73_00575, partial [Candidatus Aminicenantes bacterium]|nr:hypothetical protein [Candidatus Aminicenantes bacterium]